MGKCASINSLKAEATDIAGATNQRTSIAQRVQHKRPATKTAWIQDNLETNLEEQLIERRSAPKNVVDTKLGREFKDLIIDTIGAQSGTSSIGNDIQALARFNRILELNQILRLQPFALTDCLHLIAPFQPEPAVARKL